ncbi:hypothetical protein ACQJBY_014849 [Aegilops geniculata]
MASPQKKAGSTMDGETPHLLLPVSVTVAKTTRPDAVPLAVSAWALSTACPCLIFFAVDTALRHFLVCGQCHQPTDPLEIWMLCCVALQAAAAVLALWLPCHRRWVGRALAYLALALTIGGHCIYAAAARLTLVTDPGQETSVLRGGVIFSFLALLLLGGEE